MNVNGLHLNISASHTGNIHVMIATRKEEEEEEVTFLEKNHFFCFKVKSLHSLASSIWLQTAPVQLFAICPL